jgi:hypothetical protein
MKNAMKTVGKTVSSRPLPMASPRTASREAETLPAPLVWAFDGSFAHCLADAEDALRRAIALVGDVARVAVLIELSLPALQQRVRAGDTVREPWMHFMDKLARYGLSDVPRVRHSRAAGPLVTLVFAYRS